MYIGYVVVKMGCEWERGIYKNIVYQTCSKGKERGTIKIRNNVIPGYPHIPRIVHLAKGYTRFFAEERPFVEEKLDGYNIRVFRAGHRVLALTRGGRICPFSTEWVNEDQRLVSLVNDTGLVAACELVGAGNPYNNQSKRYGKKPRVICFDLIDTKNKKLEMLPVAERNELLDSYKVGRPHSFGRLSKEEVKVLSIKERDSIEGVVLRSADRQRVVKYVFPGFDIADIMDNYPLFPDVPAGYFVQRVNRVSIFSLEHNVSYGERLSKAFSVGMKNIVEMINSNGEIYEDFVVYTKNPTIAESIVDGLKTHIPTDVIDIKKGKIWKITIRKTYERATKFWKSALAGKGFVD